MPNYLKKRVKAMDKEETTLLGAHVPNSVAIYVSLFCEADGCTKTSIIAPLVKKWVKKAKKKFSEDDLIKVVADRGWEAWKNRTKKQMIFTVYISHLERELKKRLPEEIVVKVIEQVKYAKNKEKEG